VAQNNRRRQIRSRAAQQRQRSSRAAADLQYPHSRPNGQRIPDHARNMPARRSAGLRHRSVETIGLEQILNIPNGFGGSFPAFSLPDLQPGCVV